MGKVEEQRRQREANYEARHGQTRKAKEPTVELCGHRGVGGKSCTRDKDHSETSHRYR